MALVFQPGDRVTIQKLPINWGTPEQLKAIMDHDVTVENVEDEGATLIVKLDNTYSIGNLIIERLTIHHSWVAAQLTIEEIK